MIKANRKITLGLIIALIWLVILLGGALSVREYIASIPLGIMFIYFSYNLFSRLVKKHNIIIDSDILLFNKPLIKHRIYLKSIIKLEIVERIKTVLVVHYDLKNKPFRAVIDNNYSIDVYTIANELKSKISTGYSHELELSTTDKKSTEIHFGYAIIAVFQALGLYQLISFNVGYIGLTYYVMIIISSILLLTSFITIILSTQGKVSQKILGVIVATTTISQLTILITYSTVNIFS